MRRIAAFFVAIVIAYVSIAFVVADINFVEWTELARSLCVALALILGIIMQEYVRRK